jgi:EpsI family protein
LVPIVANWMRAYLIVLLGHLSGNKIAVGVDHLIYGWLFFGVVILSMFMIGARWSEHQDFDPPLESFPSDTGVQRSDGRIWLAALLVAILVVLPLAWRTLIERNEASQSAALPGLTLPAPQGWQTTESRAIDWRPAFANPTAELRTEFVQGERRVGVFIGYYRQQTYEHKLVSSVNVLVNSGNHDWTRVANGARSVVLGDKLLGVRTAELRGATGRRVAAWQWYWINGRLTTSDYAAKAYLALSRLQGQGDDSAVVVLYTPKDSPDGGDAALEAFAQAAGTKIESALRQVR